MSKTLRPVRQKALNEMAAVVTAMWGDRCSRVEGGCCTCAAWAVFDMMERITDGSSLDQELEYTQVAHRFGINAEDTQY